MQPAAKKKKKNAPFRAMHGLQKLHSLLQCLKQDCSRRVTKQADRIGLFKDSFVIGPVNCKPGKSRRKPPRQKTSPLYAVSNTDRIAADDALFHSRQERIDKALGKATFEDQFNPTTADSSHQTTRDVAHSKRRPNPANVYRMFDFSEQDIHSSYYRQLDQLLRSNSISVHNLYMLRCLHRYLPHLMDHTGMQCTQAQMTTPILWSSCLYLLLRQHVGKEEMLMRKLRRELHEVRLQRAIASVF